MCWVEGSWRSVTWPGPAFELRSAGVSSEAAQSDYGQEPCLGEYEQTHIYSSHYTDSSGWFLHVHIQHDSSELMCLMEMVTTVYSMD